MKLTAIGLVAMVTIVMQLSPTMACDVIDLQPCLLPIINPPEPPTASCCQALRDKGLVCVISSKIPGLGLLSKLQMVTNFSRIVMFPILV
ncbi:unnamed protein product, partial [Brassica oleracea var. botrytis]